MAGDRYLDPEFDDTDLPEGAELAALAHAAEQEATGLPAPVVRRLGARRRRRRHAAIGAGALALVVLAGGVAVGASSSLFTEPPVVADPTPISTAPSRTPSTSSVRTVTAANLPTVSDIATEGDRRQLVVTPDDVRRDPDRFSACLPDDWQDTVGATASVERNFGYLAQDTTMAEPVYYAPKLQVVALQFTDEDVAADAETQILRWYDDCPARLTEQGYVVLRARTDADTHGAARDGVKTGLFGVVPPYRGKGADEGWFESIGVTRVGDRLLVADRLVQGSDDNVSTEQDGGDATPVINQYSVIAAATERLAD